MQQIKFKARNKNNHSWVKGDLMYGLHGDAMIRDKFFIAHDVINDTVCQFTGAQDSTGKDIYEGDVVSVRSPYEFGTILFTVIFNKTSLAFMFHNDEEGTYFLDEMIENYSFDESSCIKYNIHDDKQKQ